MIQIIHTHIYNIYVYIYIYIQIHTHTYTYTYTHTHTYTYNYTHTHILHTHTHRYIYIYIYIYNIYIYIIYGIHHWQIVWSSYRKLAWVEFEPMTTEFRSDALTDWAFRPWVQLALRANFVQLSQFHRLFSVIFHFSSCLHQSPRLFNRNFLEVITWV